MLDLGYWAIQPLRSATGGPGYPKLPTNILEKAIQAWDADFPDEDIQAFMPSIKNTIKHPGVEQAMQVSMKYFIVCYMLAL